MPLNSYSTLPIALVTAHILPPGKMARAAHFKANVFRGNDSTQGSGSSAWSRACEGGLAGGTSPGPGNEPLRPGPQHSSLLAERKMQGMRHFKRGRFLSLQGYHLAICYLLPTTLFRRLMEEQKQLLIKIQNYTFHLAEKSVPKSYLLLRMLQFAEKLSKAAFPLLSLLINCAKKNRIKANVFQSTLELKVPCSPRAFSFHYEKVGFCLLLF